MVIYFLILCNHAIIYIVNFRTDFLINLDKNLMLRISEVYKSKGFKNLKTLLFGSSSSFIINAVSLLVLSRVYTKENFGIFAIFISIISLGAMLSTFRFESIIVLQKSNKESAYISHISISIVLWFSFFLIFLLIPILSLLDSFFNSHIYIWVFIPFSIYLLGNINIFLSWNNKIKNYKIISYFRLIQSSINASFGILLGYYNFELGLIISYFLGIFFHLFF